MKSSSAIKPMNGFMVLPLDCRTISPVSIKPPGLDSEVSNFVCALADVVVQFDQVG